MNKRFGMTDIILLVLCFTLCVGIKCLFHSCAQHGEYMSCYWAEQAAFGAGIALTAISAAHFALKDPKIKQGLSIAAAISTLNMILLPGVYIRLCMMSNMRCRAVMRPAVFLFGVLIIVLSAADIVIQQNKLHSKNI